MHDENDSDDDVPATGWRRLLRGDNTTGLLCLGAMVGALGAVGVLAQGSKIAYGAMSAGERHVLWLAGAAFAGFLIFSPDKTLGWGLRGLRLGGVWIDGGRDVVVLVAGALGGLALGYLLGNLT